MGHVNADDAVACCSLCVGRNAGKWKPAFVAADACDVIVSFIRFIQLLF